jgi:hypothetical protein
MLLMYYYLAALLGFNYSYFIFIVFIFLFFPYILKFRITRRIDVISLFILILIVIILYLYLFNVGNYSTPFFNDFIRLIYIFLFARYVHQLKISEQRLFFSLIGNYSCLILFPALFLEYFYPGEFKLLYSTVFGSLEDIEFSSRLSSFIGDSNALAFVLVILCYLQLNSDKPISLKFILVGLLTSFIFLTGSRMGILMLGALIVRQFGFTRILFFVFLIFLPLFFLDFNLNFRLNQSDSDADRWNSILDAWGYLSYDNFFKPLGNVFFKYNYLGIAKASHFPHFGFLYSLVEFGIFSIILFIFQFLILSKVFINDKYVFIILLMSLLFLPNQIYYMGFFLLLLSHNCFFKYSKVVL